MPPEGLCKRCELAPHKDCVNGSVWINDADAGECPNLTRIRLNETVKARLTPLLYEAPRIMESPLYTPPKVRGESAVVNRTKENLFLYGVTYPKLLPHLRLVFACLPIKFKLVDDSRLRDVFVGGESYQSTPKTAREVRETNNVIADLVGKDFDLVVIRLGALGYKNIAAPGILREALMVREGIGKPTWLFEDSSPSAAWIHSRDMDVEEYIRDRFEKVQLANEGPEAEVDDGISVDGDEDVEVPTEHMELVPKESRGSASVPTETADDSIDSLLSGGDNKKRKSGKRWG
jgi:hypothetical protein